MSIYGFTSNVDQLTDVNIIVDYPHHEIHAGSSYFVMYSALADNAGVIEVRLQTGYSAKQTHLTIHMDAALAATATMFINTTKTHAAGNAIVPLNRNFSSSNTSINTVCHTPAGTETGTARLLQYIGSANSGGVSSEGGSTSNRGEFVLANNTAYLFRLTSRANANAMTIILDWYEHTPKNQ